MPRHSRPISFHPPQERATQVSNAKVSDRGAPLPFWIINRQLLLVLVLPSGAERDREKREEKSLWEGRRLSLLKHLPVPFALVETNEEGKEDNKKKRIQRARVEKVRKSFKFVVSRKKASVPKSSSYSNGTSHHIPIIPKEEQQ